MGNCGSSKSKPNKEEKPISHRQISKLSPALLFSKILIKPGCFTEDIKKVYKFKALLGEGQFGAVRIGQRKDCPNARFAIKSVYRKTMTTKQLESLMHEVEILSNLDHPNIVKFFETYQDNHYIHIVMELCKGKHALKQVKTCESLPENKVVSIISQLVKAVRYLHSQRITHRDIKAENIMLENEDTDLEVKIIDFGFSRKSISGKMSTILGSPFYMSPEVVKGEYDKRCDIWSIGVFTHMLLTGEFPFMGANDCQTFTKICEEEFKTDSLLKNGISEEAIDFIKHCLVKDYKDRPFADELHKHDWLQPNVNPSKVDTAVLKQMLVNKSSTDFKRLISMFMFSSTPAEKMKEHIELFKAFDFNQEGFVSKEEIKSVFDHNKVEVTQREVNEMLKTADFSNNGRLNYSEFLFISMDSTGMFDQSHLEEVFKYVDIDGDGQLSCEDIRLSLLRAGREALNENEIRIIIKEVSEAEKIGFEEFMRFFH